MAQPYFTSSLIVIEIVFSIMVLIALKNAVIDDKKKKSLLITLGIIFTVWLGGVYTLISTGFFSATGMPQLAFAVAIAIPILLGLLAQKLWEPLNTALNNMSTESFLALQQMRAVFGVMFFFTTSLPFWFQLVGGLGDIAAGIGAFFVLQTLRGNPDKERLAIIRGNLIGILDFIIVLNFGLFVVLRTASPDIMFDLIPLYVVPLFILLHIFSLQKLRVSGNDSSNTTISFESTSN